LHVENQLKWLKSITNQNYLIAYNKVTFVYLSVGSNFNRKEMNLIKKTLLILLSLIICSCSKDEEEVVIKKDIKVLIVGNSTLRHSPASYIGWYGDFGMAATSKDKDFLHVYNKLLQVSLKYNYVDVYSKNIAVWENDFTYNLNDFVDITSETYDILIVRLGENVSNTVKYYTALNNMINLFKTQNTKVIITGIVWKNETKESIHEQIALENDYKYISFQDFRSNSNNYSWGLFENSRVAAHPSDIGMQNIGQLLYNATIEIY
jgi:hypothetical protein